MADEVIVEAAPVEAGAIFGVTLAAATDQQLLAPNASRASFIVSADTADAFLSYGATAAQVNKGVRLKAGGPPFVESNWKGAVHVISAGAAVISGYEEDLSVGDAQGEQPTGAQAFTPHGPSDTPIPAPTAPPPGTPIT